MNLKLKNSLRLACSEPRHFFFWLTLFSAVGLAIGIFIGMRVFGLMIPPKLSLAAALSFIFLALVFATGLLGFILAWIPPLRPFLTRLLAARFYVLAAMITLVALFYAEEDFRGKRDWDEFVRRQAVAGVSVNMADLVPPAVPDEQNFAMTPLLRVALDYSRVTNGGSIYWKDTNLWQQVNQIRVDLGQGKTGVGPRLGDPGKNTLTDLESARDFFLDNTNYPQPPANAAPAETVLVALGRFDPDLEQLKQAAASRPRSRFPIEYQFEPSFAILLPHLSQVKGICLVTQLRAVAELALGDSAAALGDLELGLRLSAAIRDEPILIDHLVRLSTLNLCLQTVKEGLARHAWNDAQLTAISRQLESINLLPEYERAMEGEEACNISGVDYFRRHRDRVDDILGSDATGVSGALCRLMPSGWYYQNMLVVGRFHTDYSFPVIDVPQRRVYPEVAARGAEATERLRPGPYNLFARIVLPAFGKAAMRTAQSQTRVDEAIVACGLERYRLAQGSWPDLLEALTPKYLASIPRDLFDGKPLRYMKEANGGYEVYSIGWNQVDDGGKAGMKQNKPEPETGDWVWSLTGVSTRSAAGSDTTAQ